MGKTKGTKTKATKATKTAEANVDYQYAVLYVAAYCDLQGTTQKLMSLVEEAHPDEVLLPLATLKAIVDAAVAKMPAVLKPDLERLVGQITAAEPLAQELIREAFEAPLPKAST